MPIYYNLEFSTLMDVIDNLLDYWSCVAYVLIWLLINHLIALIIEHSTTQEISKSNQHIQHLSIQHIAHYHNIQNITTYYLSTHHS